MQRRAGLRSVSVIEVGAYPTRQDAELAQAALAASGIPSVVEADDAGGAYPFAFGGGARLVVEDQDAEAAASILAGPDG
jgi:hypothetical protein